MNIDRFKFRVWDENRKIYPISTDFLIDYDGNLWEQCTPIDNSDNHLVIEQCTGLKDQTGKLIFEGDVLRRDTNGLIIKIIYYQGGFGWMTNYDLFIGFAGHLYIEEILQHYEVIGNIHDKQFREVTKMVEKERD